MELRILSRKSFTCLTFLLSIFYLVSCTKEVKIDIPGYQEQVVVDGSVETGKKPLVLLSKTANVYAPTNIEAYLTSFIPGAEVKVSDGLQTITLELVYTDELPQTELAQVGELLGFSSLILSNLHMPVYYGLNSTMIGEAGREYSLQITYQGKEYTASTSLLSPTQLVKVYWKPEAGYTDRGFSWAKLADPAGTYDAYKWEVKRLKGPQSDEIFTKPFNPYYDDEFFDGLTFDFAYENPMTCRDDFEPEDMRCYYALGDTVVIKYSKVDRAVYEFMEKKYNQVYSAGNPFATPINIPTNIKGGAMGVWAGFSSTYDTLICVP
jgi:hypothetical protein